VDLYEAYKLRVETIIARQWVNVSSYNSTHITYNLSVYVLNTFDSNRSLNITPDSDWGSSYMVTDLATNSSNITSFSKRFVRPNYPSQAEETITIDEASVNSTWLSNGVQIINPYDPPTKTCVFFSEEWRCLNATERGAGCMWVNNLGCQFPPIGRLYAYEGESCLFLQCGKGLTCNANDICVWPSERITGRFALANLWVLAPISLFTIITIFIFYRRRKIRKSRKGEGLPFTY